MKKISYNSQIRPILSDKCFACHGPDEANNKSGLRLDVQELAYGKVKDSKFIALVPGKPEISSVWMRITSDNLEEIMPPTKSHLEPLENREKLLIKQWIMEGASYEPHWAFLPVSKSVDVPHIKGLNSKHPIDHFVSEILQENGWKLSAEADKATLLRRVSFDLTGLPPTDEVATVFLADKSPTAYANLVDTLLASPRYGEHMAVTWLEASRYSDTTGFQHDWRWTMYPWRTWVIRAMNDNLRFDKFISWQIAGDLFPNPTKDQLLATSYNRLHRLNTENGALVEEYQVENVVDRVETVSTSMLGISLGCARCHDHKYDPVSQKEFFEFSAFFNNTADNAAPGVNTKIGVGHATPHLKIKSNTLGEGTSLVHVLITKERSADEIRPTYLLKRGEYSAPDLELGALSPGIPDKLLDFGTRPQNRLGLSQWLTDRQQPLVSRVLVNRFWQQLFGTGIVATPGDFGLQGALPSHPELLDWLAAYWMDNQWDTKKLLREIVLSNTYKQSAIRKGKNFEKDPKNALLSYFPRKRLTGYAIRDQALASSGLLQNHIGGRPVYPYQPEGMWSEIATSDKSVRNSPFGTVIYRQDHGPNLYRRSIYTFWKRASAPATLSVFDAPNREVCSVSHETTNTPLQALALLNDVTYLESARVLAAATMQYVSISSALDFLSHRLLKRAFTTQEVELLTATYIEQLAHYRLNPADARALIKQGEAPNSNALDPVQQAAWMQVALLLLNLDETITKP